MSRVRGRGGLRSESGARFASRFVLQARGLSSPLYCYRPPPPPPPHTLASQPFPANPLTVVCPFLSVSSVPALIGLYRYLSKISSHSRISHLIRVYEYIRVTFITLFHILLILLCIVVHMVVSFCMVLFNCVNYVLL
jgi:hypothetical protein